MYVYGIHIVYVKLLKNNFSIRISCSIFRVCSSVKYTTLFGQIVALLHSRYRKFVQSSTDFYLNEREGFANDTKQDLAENKS